MRTWKLEYSQGTKNWTKIVRSEELKIGSKIGNHIRLPSPCPHSLISIKHEDNSFATKFAVLFTVLLLLVVGGGCLYLVWQVIKLIIYWD